jgi:hypothetical protein
LKIWVEHLFHYYESGHTHTCVCVYYLMHNRTELAQANGGIIGARWPIRCPSKRLRVIRHILEYLFLLVFHIFRGHHARNIPHVVAILILSMMIITECINGHHRNNNKFPPPLSFEIFKWTAHFFSPVKDKMVEIDLALVQLLL